MSDNLSNEEQQQQMETIFICDDVWYEIFAFLDPVELGLKMALISDRFDVLVDEHFKLRKWSLGWLYIRHVIGGNGAQIVKLSGEQLPIPQTPLPNKVIGFQGIVVSYVDQTVIECLQRIRRLFDSSETNMIITTSADQSRSWEIIWQKIWPLINDNICHFFLLGSSQFDRLRQFSPAILRNSPNLRSIVAAGLFPELPPEDNANASSRQAVAKWLLTPRGDGRPKILLCGHYSGGMDGLKGSFVYASKPVNFIIRLRSFAGIYEPFELKNNLWGERLTLRQLNDNLWLLVRCPIGREEDKWAKWETEAIGLDGDYQWNCIGIAFKDSGIGDGLVDENDEGPSEPKN